MRIQEGILAQDNNQLRCLKMGQGKKLLIAFHGFGQDASAFKALAELLDDRYTVVAFDFPGQGRELWKSRQMPDNKSIWSFIQRLCEEFSVDKVTLVGYSMGARMAMCLTEYFPEKVEQLVLLAPDGLKKNIWYALATREFYGRIIFNQITKNPKKWLKVVNRLLKWGIVSSRWQKIVNNTLKNEEYAQRLKIDWPFTRNFIPSARFLKKTIKKYNISIQLFMGANDQVFSIEEGEQFKQNHSLIQLHVLPFGHQLLKKDCLEEITRFL